MSRTVTVLALTVIFALTWAGPAAAQEKYTDKPMKSQISYSIGYTIGTDFKAKGLDLDLEEYLKGLKDGYGGAEAKMTEAERQAALTVLGTQLQKKAQEKQVEMWRKNNEAGKAFLAENKTKEGVKETKSGLQYKVIKPGTGKKPQPTDRVTVHYSGKLLDGTEFDSSFKRGKPATFQLDGVIKGWTEGVGMMKEGAIWELYIPAELAYGERGAGQTIEPGSTLIFRVELIKVGNDAKPKPEEAKKEDEKEEKKEEKKDK